MPGKGNYQVQKMTGRPAACNCYILTDINSDEVWIIDPGIDPDEIASITNELSVEKIILTHAHYDHMGGLSGLFEATQAPIYLHSNELEVYRDPQANLTFMDPDQSGNLPDIDCTLSDGDQIQLGDASFTIRHTPGHTPGSLILVGPSEVFTGDTLFAGSVGRTDLPGGSSDSLHDSLQRCISKLPRKLTVYPGHGPKSSIGAELDNNPFLQNQ